MKAMIKNKIIYFMMWFNRKIGWIGHKKPFTPMEDLLIENANASARVIGRLCGRTVAAIRQRKYLLGKILCEFCKTTETAFTFIGKQKFTMHKPDCKVRVISTSTR